MNLRTLGLTTLALGGPGALPPSPAPANGTAAPVGPRPLRRQAAAIRAFVAHAAGAQEAYGPLIQALQQPG